MFTQVDWLQAIQESPVMMALVLCSVFTFAVAAERILYFRKRGADADALLEKIASRVRSGRTDEARTVAQEASHPLGNVCDRMLQDLRQGVSDTEESLHVALSEQKLLLEKNLGVLGSMAAVAPLIGLLGTVVGIMRAFHDMSTTGSAAPAVVAAGVAEALLTTAAGLIIAVPALLLFNHLSRRMTVMLTVAENHARRVRQAWDHARETVDRQTNSTVERITHTAETVASHAR